MTGTPDDIPQNDENEEERRSPGSTGNATGDAGKAPPEGAPAKDRGSADRLGSRKVGLPTEDDLDRGQ